MRAVVLALGVAVASPASAATVRGLVYDDRDGDGVLSAGDKGVANAVVALGTEQFVTTDSSGRFVLDVQAQNAAKIVWVRVPDGFKPGPVWDRWDGTNDLELRLTRTKPTTGPVTFVVAADTHIGIFEDEATDLARAVRLASGMAPAPAFFTILGDITQGSEPAQYTTIDVALRDFEVPWIPVPGNHDWYDGGANWFDRYGPDNYSFDIRDVHFVVWNMTLPPEQLRDYLGADLARVDSSMTIVAMTHDPPLPPVVDVLRDLGVDYVLTGHTHSNRIVDHGGVIELNTEPFLMGGLDFTPAGYRVAMIDGGKLTTSHRTVVDEPFLTLVAPRTGDCAPATGGELVVAAELGAGHQTVTARVDCATSVEMRWQGGWRWGADLGPLTPGEHTLEVRARSATGPDTVHSQVFYVCDATGTPTAGADWPQLGGNSAHTGTVDRELATPLTSRWTAALGNHVLTNTPIIAAGKVFVTTTDLADGNAGGIVAFDLATGAVAWRVATPKPIRGGVAFNAGIVYTTQIDGNVLALDAATGTVRWERAMSAGLPAQSGAVFSPPAVVGDTLLVGHQRAAGALDAMTGAPKWLDDPVPTGFNSQSAAALAAGLGIVVGTFQRTYGGVVAWDLETGTPRWRYETFDSIAINATPVVGPDAIYLVNGVTQVIALDTGGRKLWSTKLDAEGFDWGQASVGTPALAGDTLIVPTLYGSLVALDAATGRERWRYRGNPSPLRGTHYRGKGTAAFAASPVVTGSTVWTVDASGLLSALDLNTGLVRWLTQLPTPVMAGLAVSGDWLVVASYDGTVRAMSTGEGAPLPTTTPDVCPAEPVTPSGCCEADAGGALGTCALAGFVALVLGRRRKRR